MEENNNGHLLFVTRELTQGGAAYLTLRHLKRLAPFYAIDLLITGRSSKAMIELIPPQVSTYFLENNKNIKITDKLQAHNNTESMFLILRGYTKEVFKTHYTAVLATSVISDWRACIIVSLINSPNKILFLLDELLKDYQNFSNLKKGAADCCILASSCILPVSIGLKNLLVETCPILKSKPLNVFPPPIEIPNSSSDLITPNPINTVRNEKLTLLTVARLEPGKRILECLYAHKKLRQLGFDFRWYIIGGGPLELALRFEILRLSMRDFFFVLGEKEQSVVYSWLKKCDIFALFSKSEGCPTVIIEALINRCVVIMTEVNGAVDLIHNGLTGIIIPNDESAIVPALSNLICDPNIQRKIRNNLLHHLPIADKERETQFLINKIEQFNYASEEYPRVSILIPTYNQELYIELAIASALMQDYPSLEVIVIDDGSTDDTKSVCDKWAIDPRLQIFVNCENIGRVRNYRKSVVEHARGEWILLLDGDDYLIDPQFISTAVQAIHAYEDHSIVFVQAGHVVRHVNKAVPDFNVLPSINQDTLILKKGEYLEFVFRTGFFSHLGSLYNRKAALNHGVYAADISSSDMHFLLSLAMEGDVLLLNRLAGAWVQHGNNKSSNVQLNEISENTSIYRALARTAERKGLTTMANIDGVLTKYEGRTLAHLFSRSLYNRKNNQLIIPLRDMFLITYSINPRLFFNIRFLGKTGLIFIQSLIMLARQLFHRTF